MYGPQANPQSSSPLLGSEEPMWTSEHQVTMTKEVDTFLLKLLFIENCITGMAQKHKVILCTLIPMKY